MQIKIVNNIVDFKKLKPKWKYLYQKDNQYSVFQSFEFNYFSWTNDIQYKDSKLTIICIEINNKICSIFPLYIDSDKRVRFINDVHADFCDCLTIKILDFQLVLDTIKNKFAYHQIKLINLKRESKLLSLKNIPTFLKASSYSFLNLEKGNFPENYKIYKSKQKTEFKRIIKTNSINTHTIICSEKSKFPIEEIKSLRKEMIILGYRSKKFLPISMIDLLKELYDRKFIVLSIVQDDSKVKAISFITSRLENHMFWIDMFDDSKMINLFNYISFISKKSFDNHININFGRGLYRYKIKNFLPNERYLHSILIYSSRWQEFKYKLKTNLVKLLKYILRKVR